MVIVPWLGPASSPSRKSQHRGDSRGTPTHKVRELGHILQGQERKGGGVIEKGRKEEDTGVEERGQKEKRKTAKERRGREGFQARKPLKMNVLFPNRGM